MMMTCSMSDYNDDCFNCLLNVTVTARLFLMRFFTKQFPVDSSLTYFELSARMEPVFPGTAHLLNPCSVDLDIRDLFNCEKY